jgi:hypothetical protein
VLTDTDLTVESITEEAGVRTGVRPGSFRFRDGLERLVVTLRAEAGLTSSARSPVRAALVNCLVTQARLDRLVSLHPEIEQQPITRPVFVTGLPRSGTTLMHNLLAQHPDLRTPALWELVSPAGERGDDRAHRPLVDDAQAYVDDYNRLAPALRSIHLLDARRPDECHRLMANTFTSMIYEARFRVPGYLAWLRRRDLTAPYRYHRRQLQAILWRRPGGRVVLKCPFHLWSLEALIRVYPDARIVQLHRTPTETIPSMCSLCVTMRAARTDRVDRREIGQQWLDRCGAAIDDLPRARSAIPAGQILDVRYVDLLRDPVATAARVCDFAGTPLTSAAAAAMRRYLTDNRQGRYGAHRYHAADFGLDPAGLDRRFAAYREEVRC